METYYPGFWKKICSIPGAAEQFQRQVREAFSETPPRDYIIFDLRGPHHWLHFTLPRTHLVVLGN